MSICQMRIVFLRLTYDHNKFIETAILLNYGVN